MAAQRDYLDHALAQAAAFENGAFVGPWRASENSEALHNTNDCAWLPDDIGAIDMSVGERNELASYLDLLVAAEQREAEDLPTELASVAVPPWLLGMSTCASEPTVDRLSALRSTLPG